MPLAWRGRGGPRGARLHLSFRAQFDRLGFHVRFLEWYEVASMNNAWSSLAIYRLDGDSLAVRPSHSSNLEGSMRFGVYLGKALMVLKDKLAG